MTGAHGGTRHGRDPSWEPQANSVFNKATTPDSLGIPVVLDGP
jgi:hypothetical protein